MSFQRLNSWATVLVDACAQAWFWIFAATTRDGAKTTRQFPDYRSPLQAMNTSSATLAAAFSRRCSAGESGETTRHLPAAPLLVGATLLFAGCDGASEAPSSAAVPGGFFPGPTTVAFASGSGSEVPRATMTSVAVECSADADLVLREGVIDNAVGPVTYAWLSEEHAQSLLTQGLTLSPKTSEFEERVRSMGGAAQVEAVDAVLKHAAGTLVSWPRFWANRVDSSTPNPHLLRLTLRSDAWWLTEREGEVVLTDQSGNVAPLDSSAAGSLERIAGVFFARHAPINAECDSPFEKRQLVVTNPELVESWALGTDAVMSEIESEMSKLTTFAAIARACDYPLSADAWSQAVACAQSTEVAPLWWDYARSLSSLEGAYYPAVRNLARVTDLISGDLRRWAEQSLIAESEVVSEPPLSVDSGLPPGDAGALVWDAAPCLDGGDANSCGVAVPWDANSSAADAAFDGASETWDPPAEAGVNNLRGAVP